MNESMNILIITDDSTACKNYINYIHILPDTSLLTITDNIYFALILATGCNPDAIILDLKLSPDDAKGITYLRMLNESLPIHHPYILITTYTRNKKVHDKARKLGADFIISKYQGDYSEQNAVEFLRLMRDAKNALDFNHFNHTRFLTVQIHKELDALGINPKNLGYKYLTDAILLLLQNSRSAICNELSVTYQKSPQSIGRAMQHAIDCAWKNMPSEELKKLYTAPIISIRGIPTHSEFVYYCATKLKQS